MPTPNSAPRARPTTTAGARVTKPKVSKEDVSTSQTGARVKTPTVGQTATAAAPRAGQGVGGAPQGPTTAGARSPLGSARAAAGSVGGAAKGASTRVTRAGVGAARNSAKGVGHLFAVGGSAPAAATAEPVAGMTVKLPFLSGSLQLPGPGAVASVGPVRVTLPTGALYYGGLAALVVGGSLELPVAAGAALAGAVFARRWLRRPVPHVSVFDATPTPSQAARASATESRPATARTAEAGS